MTAMAPVSTPASSEPATEPVTPSRSRRSFWNAVRRYPALSIGLTMLALLSLAAILAPVLSPYDPNALGTKTVLFGPSWDHPFGTDNLGRDLLSRVLHGYRISLVIAFASTIASLAVGVPLGLFAGYAGKWTDQVIMRILDVFFAFPTILLAIALISVFGSSTWILIFAIGTIYVPYIARVARGSTLALKRELFVEGARARGAGDLRLIARHILPNSLSALLVQASLMLGYAILIEATLSFLGLGTPPPAPSLGRMLADGRDFMTDNPAIVIFPGLAIALAVLSFNLIGDGIRDLTDPRRRARGE
jgi:peptide/nickel transport system permease protein